MRETDKTRLVSRTLAARAAQCSLTGLTTLRGGWNQQQTSQSSPSLWCCLLRKMRTSWQQSGLVPVRIKTQINSIRHIHLNYNNACSVRHTGLNLAPLERRARSRHTVCPQAHSSTGWSPCFLCETLRTLWLLLYRGASKANMHLCHWRKTRRYGAFYSAIYSTVPTVSQNSAVHV